MAEEKLSRDEKQRRRTHGPDLSREEYKALLDGGKHHITPAFLHEYQHVKGENTKFHRVNLGNNLTKYVRISPLDKTIVKGGQRFHPEEIENSLDEEFSKAFPEVIFEGLENNEKLQKIRKKNNKNTKIDGNPNITTFDSGSSNLGSAVGPISSRTSSYTEEKINKILDLVASGNTSANTVQPQVIPLNKENAVVINPETFITNGTGTYY